MLNVTNVTKKFGELTAVNDLSFSVAKGQVLGITGPEDAGKSPPIKGLHSFKDENRSGFPFSNHKNIYFTNLSKFPDFASLKQDMSSRNTSEKPMKIESALQRKLQQANP